MEPSNHLSNAHFHLKGGEELEVGAALRSKCSDLPGGHLDGDRPSSHFVLMSPCAYPSEHLLHKCPRGTSPTDLCLHRCLCKIACCPHGWDCVLARVTGLGRWVVLQRLTHGFATPRLGPGKVALCQCKW